MPGVLPVSECRNSPELPAVGATVEELKAECREHCGDGSATGDEWVQTVLDRVFSLDPIRWVRAHDFQIQSVKMVVQRALPHLPFYVKYPLALQGGLKLRGELPPRAFSAPVTLITCAENRGAPEVAEEVKAAAEASGPHAVRVENAETVLATAIGGRPPGKLYLILYLNESTFLDPGGVVAATVKRAINLKIPISMVHEQDAAKGGRPFSIFFDQAPRELLVAPYNLFAPMAIPLFSMAEHRQVCGFARACLASGSLSPLAFPGQVSMRHILRDLGAIPVKRTSELGSRISIRDAAARLGKSASRKSGGLVSRFRERPDGEESRVDVTASGGAV